ncbi:MAG: hypothetical protein Q8K64_12430 [Sediminibacterium sp.]|nr:hypothetical protein [Sediminibacterium sp.]
MSTTKITRREFYDLVWAKPISNIAKEYGIGEDELRKTCILFKIPLPKNGYWMKLRYGKPIEVESFIEDYNGSDEISIRTANQDLADPVKNILSPLQEVQLDIEKDPKVNLKVPEIIKEPTEIIKATIIELNRKNKFSGGIGVTNNYLRMVVSEENVDRSLRFMDTFIKAIRQRGHQFTVDGWNVYVTIYEQKINVKIRESYKRVLVKGNYYDHTDKVKNGILCFQTEEAYRQIYWKDGNQKLEEQLSKIIANLEILGRERYNAEIEWKKKREQDKIERNIQLKKQKAVLDELKRFKELLNNAKKYNEVIMMRDYIDAVKSRNELSDIPNKENLEDWINWARKKVDWYDPLINLPDTDFINVDKQNLELKNRLSEYGLYN